MQPVYILNNQYGILLGMYKTLSKAQAAYKLYLQETNTILYLYKVDETEVNLVPKNRFNMINSNFTTDK